MFRKCETLLQNIVYMAIMAAINIVFVLISTLFPIAFISLIFILPLTSTVVTIFCNKKYFIIYFIATSGLCMLATLWNISDTIFYVIPSLISGFVFGIFLERKIPAIYAILLVSLLQFGLHYLGILITRLLVNIDIIQVFVTAFNLSEHPYLSFLIPGFIFFLALTQTSLTFLIVQSQIKKLQLPYKDINIPYWFDFIVVTVNTIIMVLFALFLKSASWVNLFISLFIYIYFLATAIMEKNKISIIGGASAFLIALIIFICTYNFVETPLQILMFNIATIVQSIIGLFNNSSDNKSLKVK